MAEKNNKTEQSAKKGWFDKLKDAVMEDSDSSSKSEDLGASSAPDNFKTATGFQYSTNIGVNAMPGVNFNQQGQFDQNFYNRFLQLIEEKNLPGTDYFEFSKAKKKLDSNQQMAGMPEPAKYQSAFIPLQSNDEKLTKESLLQSIDHYLNELDKEQVEFMQQHDSELTLEVNARFGEMEKEAQEIAALNVKIQEKQQKIGTLNVEAETAKAKIEATSRNFKVTFDAFTNQIKQDKTNIQNFIS